LLVHRPSPGSIGHVIKLKFAGHELVGLIKNSEEAAERLLIKILKDESARELKRLLGGTAASNFSDQQSKFKQALQFSAAIVLRSAL
jgi:hypothetical protein